MHSKVLQCTDFPVLLMGPIVMITAGMEIHGNKSQGTIGVGLFGPIVDRGNRGIE
jgi:hypothetical protein